jgi:hypothetical protein
VICSLNITFLSIIIPRYFMVFTCQRSLLFRYISRSFLSFLFRRVISITFDFWSLNRTLLSFAHFEILFSSTLAVFSTSLTDFPLVSLVVLFQWKEIVLLSIDINGQFWKFTVRSISVKQKIRMNGIYGTVKY